MTENGVMDTPNSFSDKGTMMILPFAQKKHHASNSGLYRFIALCCVAALSICGCDMLKTMSEEGENAQFFASPGDSSEHGDMVRANAPRADKEIYKLFDPRTMIQILQYKHPDGWFAGSKADWNFNNSTVPHFYYTYAVAPDASMQFAFSSEVQMMGQGRIDQNPFAQPRTFAEQVFVQSAEKDYNISNVRIVDARYEQAPDAMQKQQQMFQEMSGMGLRPTEIRCLIYNLKVQGTRDGKAFFVSYVVPMNFIETKPGMSYVHMIDIPSAVSYGGFIEKESQIQQIANAAIQTLDVNPQFLEYKRQVAQELTTQSIAETNRKFDIIRQRHIQNMRDSDARMDAWQRESDRKHAQVMGGSGGGSGSMLDKWDEYIKDVDRVSNPNGGDMYIDNRYDHAWINSDNEVMYMDSGSFNPNENAAFNNREWKRVR